MKNLYKVIIMLSVSISLAWDARADVFLDFESFVVGSEGAHVFNTALGTVTFNARVDNSINGDLIGDHTLGDDVNYSGRFWRNSSSDTILDMSFDFDVAGLSLFGYGFLGNTYTSEFFDVNNSSMGVVNISGLDESWVNFEGLLSGLRRFTISTSGNGNDLAIDDITFLVPAQEPSVPEPSTMMLLSSSFAGLMALRKRFL